MEATPLEAYRGDRTILFGGSGFLGSRLLSICPELISVGRTRPANANRHVHVDSLSDVGALSKVAFDRVIMLIGTSHHSYLGKSTWLPGELTAFDYHVTPTLQILEQLKQYPIKKLLHFSTVLLYDQSRLTLPADEDSPVDPYRTRYILSKHVSEEVCRFFAQSIPIVNVRLSNMYGPSHRERWDIIHVLARQLVDTGTAQVSSIKPARDFIYVDDAAAAVFSLLNSELTGTVNLGSGNATTVSTVVEILERISGGMIANSDAGFDGPLTFWCDIGRLQASTGWSPKCSIDEGIGRVYQSLQR